MIRDISRATIAGFSPSGTWGMAVSSGAVSVSGAARPMHSRPLSLEGGES